MSNSNKKTKPSAVKRAAERKEKHGEYQQPDNQSGSQQQKRRGQSQQKRGGRYGQGNRQ